MVSFLPLFSFLKSLEENIFAGERESLSCGGSNCEKGAIGCVTYASTREETVREDWRRKRREIGGVEAVQVGDTEKRREMREGLADSLRGRRE